MASRHFSSGQLLPKQGGSLPCSRACLLPKTGKYWKRKVAKTPYCQLIPDRSGQVFHKPSTPSNENMFDLTVFCPPLIFGPWAHPLGQSGLASSTTPSANSETSSEVTPALPTSQTLRAPLDLEWEIRDLFSGEVQLSFCGGDYQG